MQPTAMRRIMRDLASIQQDPPEDIRVQVDEEDILSFHGIIAGPEGTPYHGGYFRVRFTFGDDFPASPPKCHFVTKIFHPNVSPTSGDICVNALKKDWQPSFGIKHILTVIRCLLIYPNPDSALDEEAGKMVRDDWDSFVSRAKIITSVHATRGGRPLEFQTTAADIAETDPLALPLGIPTLSSITPSPISSSSGSSVFPSSSSNNSTIQVQSSSRSGSQPQRSSTTLKFSSVQLPTGSVPPLQTSSQTNSALGALPLKQMEKEAKADVPMMTASGKKIIRTTTSALTNSGIMGSIGVKRPASAVIGKESVIEKRKKALKRL